MLLFSCVMMLCFSVLYYETHYVFYSSYRPKIFLIKRSREKTKKKWRELLELLIERVRLEDGELHNMTSVHDAVTRVNEYERLIKSKKQYVINLSYKQGFILHKFKESKQFTCKVEEFGISESMITFKINLYKLLTNLFPMHSFSTLWKSYCFLKVLGGRERVQWEQISY